MLEPDKNGAVSGSTIWASKPSVLPARLTKGATVTYSRRSEDTSASEAAPIPHHSTLNPQLTSKPLEHPKKSSGEGHQEPSTNPSREPESRQGKSPPHFRGVRVRRPIDAAKEAISVVQLAERLSGPGTRRGKEVFFRCPFHDDRNPSLRVDPDKGVWYCDPCAVGGNVVELARRAWGHTDDGQGAAEAAAFLLMEFGHKVPQHPPSWFRKQERQRAVRDTIDEARVEVLLRRLWLWIFEPILADLEDADERERVGDELWAKVLPRAKQLVEERGGKS
jgi:hypothetical protein